MRRPPRERFRWKCGAMKRPWPALPDARTHLAREAQDAIHSMGPIRSTTRSPPEPTMSIAAFTRRIHRLASLVMSAGTVGLLVGCASVTPIGELLDNATRYDGKTVRIEGEVRESAGG